MAGYDERPKVGMKMAIYNKTQIGTIIKVLDFGTVEVVDANGNHFRITGLSFL